jgi:hypothetical protein
MRKSYSTHKRQNALPNIALIQNKIYFSFFAQNYHKALDEKEAKEIQDILLNHAKDFRDQLAKK